MNFTPTEVSLENRIAAAFTDGPTSDDVESLITEVEAASRSSNQAAEQARQRALDPTLSPNEVAEARRAMEDAAFARDRLTARYDVEFWYCDKVTRRRLVGYNDAGADRRQQDWGSGTLRSFRSFEYQSTYFEETRMVDKDRIKGSAEQAKGKVKEWAGKATGDKKTQAKGKAEQVKGKVRNAAGGLKDAVRGK
jgi:uncharacterized protein YjbJ (UPF0337 family)